MSVPTLGIQGSMQFARSPIFVAGRNDSVAGDNLYSMLIQVYVYTGTQVQVTPVDIALEKLYAINKRINFEISEILRPNFGSDFDIWTITNVQPSPTGEVQWTKITGDWTYSDAGATPITAAIGTNYFYATYGWSDKFNPSNPEYNDIPLTLPRIRRTHEGGYDALPVQYDSVNGNLQSIVFTYNGALHIYNVASETSIPNTSPISYNKVLYIPVGYENFNTFAAAKGWPAWTEGSLCLDFYSEVLPPEEDPPFPDLSLRRCIELDCTYKYEPISVAFVNRYGVADYMTFYKVSTEQEEYSREKYNRSIYNDPWTTIDLQDGKYKDFNVQGRVTWTLNSDWVEENYNDVIEDILMSENVALYLNGVWIAAQPQESSYEKFKEVNQGLINHTLSFKIAFDQRTLIR